MILYSIKCVLYRFELQFFYGTVTTGQILRWGAVKLPIYLSIYFDNLYLCGGTILE